MRQEEEEAGAGAGAGAGAEAEERNGGEGEGEGGTDGPPAAAAPSAASAAASAAAPDPSLDAIVADLTRNPELIALVERSVASLALAPGPPSSDGGDARGGDGGTSGSGLGSGCGSGEVARRAVRRILLERFGGAGAPGRAAATIAAPAAAQAAAPSSRPPSVPAAAPPPVAPSAAHPTGAASVASGGEDHGGRRYRPPVKTVTFSTISVPDLGQDDEAAAASGAADQVQYASEGDDVNYDGEVDEEGQARSRGGERQGNRRGGYRRSLRGRSVSPPPPPFPSLLQDSYNYAPDRPGRGAGAGAGVGGDAEWSNRRARSRSPTAMSSVTSADFGDLANRSNHSYQMYHLSAGEGTASGDESSVTTALSRGSRNTAPSVTFAPGVFFANDATTGGGGGTAGAGAPGAGAPGAGATGVSTSSANQHVHFSAMNPNPSLSLAGARADPQANLGDGARAVSFQATDVSDRPPTPPRRRESGVSFQVGDGVGVERHAAATRRGSGGSGGGGGGGMGRSSPVGDPCRSRSRSPPVAVTRSDRSVSWGDEQPTVCGVGDGSGGGGSGTNSRGSRSGVSSPTIEPPLSPVSASSRNRAEHVQFNNDVSVIDTITEAADRLREEQAGDDQREGREGAGARSAIAPELAGSTGRPAQGRTEGGRVVHFSAMRAPQGSAREGGGVTPEQFQATATQQQQRSAASSVESVVHFADEGGENDGNARRFPGRRSPPPGLF